MCSPAETPAATETQSLAAASLSPGLSVPMFTRLESTPQLRQGLIIRETEVLEDYREIDGELHISSVLYPYLLVISQSCDLEHHYGCIEKGKSEDKVLPCALLLPLYNYLHVKSGEHLSHLDRRMQIWSSKTKIELLQNNEIPRYHYLKFSKNDPLVDSVLDFKHAVAPSFDSVHRCLGTCIVGIINPPYIDRISQRFANFVSRIGLPEAP
ncbi:MAG: hypothetical protein AB7G17_01560 [Phycisphaerales bacterium]